jgi:signal transduction histidine kinase
MGQEALTNVAKHSEAGEVILRLVATPEEVELSVEDDGRGFEPSDAQVQRYGLVGISERARLLGGTMSLESSTGVGTRVSIRVPQVTSGSDGAGMAP